MFAIFGPSIPTREVVLQWLPQEYKNEVELFDETKTEESAIETGSRINILLTRRELFFSQGGYLTKDEGGTPYRIWARLHYDEKQQSNGIILCMMSQGYFSAWKGSGLCLDDKSLQSVSWEKDPEPKFTFKEKGGTCFPNLLKNMLKREVETGNLPKIVCDIEVISEEEIAKVREFCGTAQLPLPPKLYEAVYPKTPFQKAMPYLALVGVAAVAYYFWNRSKG